jgi:hypothetical protein
MSEKTGESVLGVNLAAGVAYLGLVGRPDRVMPKESVKILPPTNMDEWSVLHEFGQRMLAEARVRHVETIAFVEPGMYGGWKYWDAHRRGALETAVGLACRPTGVRVVTLPQKTIAAAFGCKGARELGGKLAAVLDLEPADVLHWDKRGIALAAALCRARKTWPQ